MAAGHQRTGQDAAAAGEAGHHTADRRVDLEGGTAAAAGLAEADHLGKTEELPVSKQCQYFNPS